MARIYLLVGIIFGGKESETESVPDSESSFCTKYNSKYSKQKTDMKNVLNFYGAFLLLFYLYVISERSQLLIMKMRFFLYFYFFVIGIIGFPLWFFGGSHYFLLSLFCCLFYVFCTMRVIVQFCSMNLKLITIVFFPKRFKGGGKLWGISFLFTFLEIY